jgi:16S rRNA (guanine527-N7)-methyltransferase
MNSVVMEKSQVDQFERYHDELIYWNDKVNLISRKDLENIYERHMIHSLTILRYLDIKKKAKCLDIGTGGGFPGLPLAIARPDLKMLLLDSIAKKIKITDMFAKHTGLRGVQTMHARVEELHADRASLKSYDYIFARAVTATRSIMAWSEPLLKNDGKVVLLKGGDLTKEIEDAKVDFPRYDYKVIDIELIGMDWFKKEEKKILVCSKK